MRESIMGYDIAPSMGIKWKLIKDFFLGTKEKFATLGRFRLWLKWCGQTFFAFGSIVARFLAIRAYSFRFQSACFWLHPLNW